MILPLLAQYSRLVNVVEISPAWIIILALVCLTGLLQIGLSKNAIWLVPFYLILCTFSGHIISQLDTGTTLLRWWLIICFCAAALKIGKYPGPICMMLGCYWLFSLFSLLWSPNFFGGIQLSGMNVLMNCGASCALAGVISSPLEMKKIVNEYCLISIIFIANGFIGIGNLSGGRYAGAMNDAVGLFVITGGLLMPALLWACLFHVKSARIAAGIAFLLVTLLCVLSGQRTGFFAGIIGCIPLIFQVNGKFLIRGLIVFSAVITFCIFAIQLFPQQTDFITKRYFDINRNRNISIRVDTTGRSLLWKRAFDKTMEKPILGHGAAADRISEIKGFHNAYLQEWYNGGIFGPALFFGASVLALFKTFRLSQSKTLDDEAQQISRLLFSWMIVLFLTSFFESKLASPSNIMAFTMVLIGVMTHRLEIYANSVALPQPQNRFYLTR